MKNLEEIKKEMQQIVNEITISELEERIEQDKSVTFISSEDIKTVDNFITYFNENIQDGYKADLTVLGEEIEAMQHILSDYKRVLEMNKTLLKENEEWREAYQEEKDKQFELLRENQKLKNIELKSEGGKIKITLEGILSFENKIKELENKNNVLKQDYDILMNDIQDRRFIYIDTPEFEQNYISVQKVKNKIVEHKERKAKCNDIESEIRLDAKIRAYEELLEGRK